MGHTRREEQQETRREESGGRGNNQRGLWILRREAGSPWVKPCAQSRGRSSRPLQIRRPFPAMGAYNELRDELWAAQRTVSLLPLLGAS